MKPKIKPMIWNIMRKKKTSNQKNKKKRFWKMAAREVGAEPTG